MVRSMTGYGNAAGQAAGCKVTVEIRSLNSKFLELNLRIPNIFRDRETELRSELSKSVERGKADLLITLDNNEPARKSTINKELFKAYYEELKIVSEELGLQESSWLDTILKLPNVLSNDKSDLSDEQLRELLQIINLAVKKFDSFRIEEGKVLEQELAMRITNILHLVEAVEPFEKERIEIIKQRLLKSMNDIKESTRVDENRFEQELVYYIEKLDISEEKLRLRSHCNYFTETIKGNEANGKKLSFIAQEIGREINTLGSKANDANIQRRVVEMKDELEKLKEQLANAL